MYTVHRSSTQISRERRRERNMQCTKLDSFMSYFSLVVVRLNGSDQQVFGLEKTPSTASLFCVKPPSIVTLEMLKF